MTHEPHSREHYDEDEIITVMMPSGMPVEMTIYEAFDFGCCWRCKQFKAEEPGFVRNLYRDQLCVVCHHEVEAEAEAKAEAEADPASTTLSLRGDAKDMTLEDALREVCEDAKVDYPSDAQVAAMLAVISVQIVEAFEAGWREAENFFLASKITH